jgi:hypothetical protein
MVPATVNLKKLLDNRSRFKKKLKEWGWDYHLVPGDGWCLFHAVAVTIGRAGQGKILMEEVVDHMMKNKKEFKGFMEDNESLETHIAKVRAIGWSGQPELLAISQLTSRPIEMWAPGDVGIPTIRKPYVPAPGSIKLAYYPGNHYDALLAGGKSRNLGELSSAKQESLRASPPVEGSPVMGNGNENVGASLATTAGSKRVLSNDSEKGTGR